MKTNVLNVATLLGSLVPILLFATGCQSISATHTKYPGAAYFPPSNPAQVQVLRTEPKRPHVRLGKVSIEPSDISLAASKLDAALRNEAAKLGADAAVVIYDKTQIMGGDVVTEWSDGLSEEVEGRVIIAIAIKFQ